MREGLIEPDETADAADDALDVAQVVDRKLVGEDQLADLLAREAGSVVIDLDQGTLESEAVALLGHSLARKSLAMPVALEPGGAAIQVAFANPLDTGTMAAIAASTGCEVRALVATVTAIRRALDREYGPEGSPTRVLGMRRSETPLGFATITSDGSSGREPTQEFLREGGRESGDSTELPLPPESTRRLPEGGPITLPLHRLESEATVEQRFEALLSVLVERRIVARTDYAEALRRLLHGEPNDRPRRGNPR